MPPITQAHFNTYVLRQQQDVYLREGVTWQVCVCCEVSGDRGTALREP
jgi:hypothetical protein